MNYYDEIKKELIENEINRRIKNYSINKSDLNTYYNVGKMLSEAGKHYGKGIIKEYSKKLTIDLGKGYTFSSLTRMKKLYLLLQKLATVSQHLTYELYIELMTYNDLNKDYSIRLLYRMLKYYNFIMEGKVPTLSAKLSWSHYDEILKFDDVCKISYYIKISEQQNLSIRQLRAKVKANEYERLPDETKYKFIDQPKDDVVDLVKNPLMIKDNHM